MKNTINEKTVSLNDYACYSWILCECFNRAIETYSFKEIKAVIRENMKDILENYGFKSIHIKDTALAIRFLGKYERIWWWLDEQLCEGIPLNATLEDLELCFDCGLEYTPTLHKEIREELKAMGL